MPGVLEAGALPQPHRSLVLPRLISWFAAMVLTAGLHAQTIVQEYYVPMPEAQIRQSFLVLASNTGSTMDSVVSMVVGASNTKVVYDHWEDGYEIDIDNPTQSSTRIWGDGIDGNGIAPGFANDPPGLGPGTVIALRNLVSLPRNPSSVLYDGRDRVGATKGIVMSRSAWATSPGPVLADATEVSATIDWGNAFVIPIGQDEVFPTPADKSMFEVVSLFVQAAQNGTSVQIDADANGVAESTVTLNQGENYYLGSGVMKGATVTSSKPVQVHLLTGDIGANYESRWFNIPPLDQWGPSYFSPVGTAADGDDTYIFLYNPDVSPIIIYYESRVSSGSFSISGKSSYRFLMPQESGARFSSSGEKPFFGIGTVGAEPTSNNVHDWGFSLIPRGNLTTAAVVGWGPGSGDLSVNGSPVWISTVSATRLYVDYNGDKAGPLTDSSGDSYDVHYDVQPFQITRLYDPDKDQTGMRVYTLDGTLLSGAWGQDPAVAGSGNPYLDVGTTVPAFPVPVITKTSAIAVDVGTPGLSLGDTLEYTITMNNQSLVALGNVLVLDGLPVQLQYVPDTTTRDGVAIPDFMDPTTLFPLDENGVIVPVLPRKKATVIKYRADIVGTGTILNTVNTSYGGVNASNTVTVSTGGTPCNLNFTNSSGTPRSAFAAGDGIYVTVNEPDLNLDAGGAESFWVIINNTTHGDYEAVQLVETGNNTGVFRNTTPLPSSLTTGLGPEDGTLHVSPADGISASHVDAVNGETCSAVATIAVPSLIKQLYLTTDGADGDVTGGLDRKDPVALADASTSQTSDLSVPLSVPSLDSTSSSSVSSGSSLSFSHSVGSAANRLLLVGVSLGATSPSGNPPSLSGVTFNGTALTLVGSKVSGSGGSSDDMISYIYQMVNPPNVSANVVVSASGTGVIIAGASSFSNVHQGTPLGSYQSNASSSGSATVSVSSAATDLVFSTVAWDEKPTITVSSGQTSRWNITSSNPASGAASTSAGGGTVVHTYTGSISNQDWAVSGVAVKPAPVTGSASVTFTQTPAFAESLSMPAGALVGAELWYSLTSGTMPASPAITATLRYGSTVIATSSGATASGGKLSFSFPALSGVNIVPAGQAVVLSVTSAQAGVSFRIDYDSQSKPSLVSLPTTTVIHVDTVGVYDAPYPDGDLITTPANGQTLYVRTLVGDPFGHDDITSLPLSIDGPGTADDVSVTLGAGNEVNTTAATKTYEYVWATGSKTGAYNIAVTAKEGYENTITSSRSTSVTLSYLDLGTPSITEFTLGLNGGGTSVYDPDEMVCVRVTDLDQNLNSSLIEELAAVITSSSGDTETVVLTETGPNTGIFTFCIPASATVPGADEDGTLFATPGALLEVVYVDPDDSSDTSSDTASVPLPSGTPGISIVKTRLLPVDGQAVVGEGVQYRLRVTNTGTTTLSNISVTDVFPAATLGYTGASVTPDTVAAGVLTWRGVGPLLPSQKVDLTVSFTALASASPALNSASVDAGGGVTDTSQAGVVITRPSVTVGKTLVSPTPGPAAKGDNVVFNISVYNSGDTAISTLPLEDTFSGASYQFVSASVAPDASGSGSLLWLDITGGGSLAPGASQVISVTLKAVGAANPANNRAAVDFAEDVNGDPVPPASSTVGIEIKAASILGSVYEDRGASGFGGGDLPVSGAGIRLYTDPDGDGDPLDGTLVGVTSTQADGSYEFLNLAIGKYVIVETDPIGFDSVADTQGGNDNRIAVELLTATVSSGHDFLDVFIDPADYGNFTGQVRNDVDADGDLGDADSGIPSVTVELYTDPNGDGSPADGVLFSTTLTNGSGNYAFNLVPPGSYVVVEQDPAGYFSTADKTLPNDNRIAASVVAGGTSSGNDFLDTANVAAMGSIGNLVWSDADNNGQLGGGEAGIESVAVLLYRSTQTPGVDLPYKSTMTSGAGIYGFGKVPADSYIIHIPVSNFQAGGALFGLPLSSIPTSASDDQTDGDDNGIQSGGAQPVSSPLIQITAGESDATVDFGFVPNLSLGVISGTVSEDVNNDDAGDAGIGLVGITLHTDPDGDGDPSDGVVQGTAVTAADGSYTFTGLPPGRYVVVEAQPAGFLDVTDTDGGVDNKVALNLPAAGSGTASFVEERTGSISGTVFVDPDGDGAADSRLAGVLIRLLDAAGNPVLDGGGDPVTTLTLPDGTYGFGGLPPGDYCVSQDQPANYASVSDSDGPNDSVIGNVVPIKVVAGSDNGGNDFIEIELGVISGHVGSDTDQNGSGETALSGVVLNLLDGAGNPVLDGLGAAIRVATNSSGFYNFTQVPVGSYRVSQTQPTGYGSISDVDGANNNIIGDESPINMTPGLEVTGMDFVEIEFGVISGRVFKDTNDGGSGDTLFPGVTLTLLDTSGDPVDGDPLSVGVQPLTALTGIDGSYRFENLYPADYQVAETQPAGYGSVSDADGGDPDLIGNITAITVSPGQVVSDRDFTEIELGSINGYVLVGMSPLSGVTLTLLDEFGNPVDGDPDTPGVQSVTTTTNGSGFYSFTGVLPGIYQVGQSQPYGYESIGDIDGGDVNIIGDVNPVDIAPGQTSADNNFTETVDTCPDDWDQWKYQHPAESADGNPDADAYDNFAEFAFAMPYDKGTGSPRLGNTAWIIQPSVTIPGTLEGVFVRPKGALLNVTYTLQYAAMTGNPTVWQSVVITPLMYDAPVDNGDCTETVTLRDLEMITGLTAGKGLVRIRADLDDDGGGDGDVDHTSHTETEGWTVTDLDVCCRTYNNPYQHETAFTGTVTEVNGQVLGFAVNDDLGALLVPGASYYLEVSAGAHEGHRFDVISTTGNTVTLAMDGDLHSALPPFNTIAGSAPADLGPLAPGKLVGDLVTIHRHRTLDEFFPPRGFGARGSQSAADQVQVFAGGSWTIYWLYDEGDADPDTARWVDTADSGMADKGATVIPPGQGMFFNNRSALTSIMAYGEIRQNDFIRPHAAGNNLVGGGYPVDQAINLPLGRSMSKGTGFFASTDFKKADSVFVWKADASLGASGYDTYYLLGNIPTRPTLTRWVTVGDVNIFSQDSAVLLMGNRSVFTRTANELPAYKAPSPWGP